MTDTISTDGIRDWGDSSRRVAEKTGASMQDIADRLGSAAQAMSHTLTLLEKYNETAAEPTGTPEQLARHAEMKGNLPVVIDVLGYYLTTLALEYKAVIAQILRDDPAGGLAFLLGRPGDPTPAAPAADAEPYPGQYL